MIRGSAARGRNAVVRPAYGLAIGFVMLLCCWGFLADAVQSAEMEIVASETGPALILVKGDLDLTDAVQFTRLAEGVEEATVFLQSPGGVIFAGLSMGKTIRQKGFVTVVPPAASCISACALAWLGGAERFMAENSRIGFHAAYVVKYGRRRTSAEAQAVIAKYLQELQLPQRAVDYVTSAPPQGLYMLTLDRARDLGLEVGPYTSDVTASIDAMPAKVSPGIKRLPQVDLYGRNLPDMPIELQTADECEAQCTARQSCTAYTFNTARSACFLKSSAEIAVSHPAAISGYRDRAGKSIRRINMAIQEATDYPGNDIGRQRATSFEACLISCGKTKSCKAFSYVVRRQECWFKNRTGSAEPRDGVVSGVK